MQGIKDNKIKDAQMFIPPETPSATLTPLFPDRQRAGGNGKQEERKTTAAGTRKDDSDDHLTARYWG